MRVDETAHTPLRRITVQVNATTCLPRVEVSAKGPELTSRAGTVLLSALADRLGLTAGLTKALRVHTRLVRHEPGRGVRDLAVLLADGGDCLTDLGALRDQEVLFGPLASDATAYRCLERLDAAALARIRTARAAARARAWKLDEAPRRLILDFDATLLTAHSDKEGAAGNYKGGFGFHPLLCCEATSGEAMAGILRPGNAGANTAADHITVLELALAQLPQGAVNPGTLVRCDSAGATHAFLDEVSARGLAFSVGCDLSERLRASILALPESAWSAALDSAGGEREGAWVAELDLDLSSWPKGTRALCRRERPHPGAQLSFSDAGGHRFQVTLTNQQGQRLARLEQVHRQRAAIEDAIRCGKASGLRNLTFRSYAMNAAWLELVLIGVDLLAWTRRLLLADTQLAACEPKRLRYRLLHVAGRLVRHARRVRLRLSPSWPWTEALAAAFTRLQALPSG